MSLANRKRQLAIEKQLKTETAHIDEETAERETHSMKRCLRVTSVAGMVIMYTAMIVFFCIYIRK